MPSKMTTTHELCFPCIWHSTRLWKSGLHPIYQRYCNHPKAHEDGYYDRHEPRLIGETDERPDFCPIRNDPQAEREAMEND